MSGGEDVEKLEHSLTAHGTVKCCRHLGNSLALPQKVKHTVII